AAYMLLRSQPKLVVRSYILPPEKTTLVPSGPPVVSPDGTRVVFSARDDKGKSVLYVRALNSLTAQTLAGTESVNYPFWSADSRSIGFFGGGKLRKVEASGGPPQALCDVV